MQTATICPSLSSADRGTTWRSALFHRFVNSQMKLAARLDRLLPVEFRTDGNRDFLDSLLPGELRPGLLIYDVGGGKNPVIGADEKARSGLRIVGLDIDARELEAAPQGAYDQIICADIAGYSGRGDADLVICQALLEHVRDSGAALRAIASILRTGGRALIFVPSRNAVYARINRLLPEGLKRRLLYAVFPEMRRDHGFPAFYDRCTPRRLAQAARSHGLEPVQCRVYFYSTYFRFCFPLYALWRMWQLLFRRVAASEAAETISLVLRKEP